MSELRVLQYRQTFVNGTPIQQENGVGKTAGNQLTLINVAIVKENGEIQFVSGDRYSIWPGKLFM